MTTPPPPPSAKETKDDATPQGRWAGHDPRKDVVRAEVWERLSTLGWSVGPTWSCIPNFVGADMAAWRLAQTAEWKAARTIKCNPDPPQIPIRLRALYQGKVVYAPVPYLTQDFPYLRLDPKALAANNISFELAATSQGFVQHGERIGFEDVVEGHLDFCVVGSVAVSRQGGRTGKGAGFADLETGIFRELGIMDDQSVFATTIHSCQLVDDDRVCMMAHDSPLDYVATEEELIVCRNEIISNGGTTASTAVKPRPTGVAWDSVREDQFQTIPFLRKLRERMEHGDLRSRKTNY